MKSKKNSNPIDQLIYNLTNEFLKIENFELTQTDPQANTLFNFVTFRISDITAYKGLVLQSFLPAVNKEIALTNKYIQTSFFKRLLNRQSFDLNESYYETIRMAYVVVFHKYESFANEFSRLMNEFSTDIDDSVNRTFVEFAKKEFDFKIVDWKTTSTLERINWICICIKHYDGKPLKQPVHLDYMFEPQDQKLRLSKEDFARDCDRIQQTMTNIIKAAFLIKQFWMFHDPEFHKRMEFSEEFMDEQKANEEVLRGMITTLISSLKHL